MPKLPARLIACLLVYSLIFDPVTTSIFSSPAARRNCFLSAQENFASEALIDSDVFFLHDYGPRVRKIANALLKHTLTPWQKSFFRQLLPVAFFVDPDGPDFPAEEPENADELKWLTSLAEEINRKPKDAKKLLTKYIQHAGLLSGKARTIIRNNLKPSLRTVFNSAYENLTGKSVLSSANTQSDAAALPPALRPIAIVREGKQWSFYSEFTSDQLRVIDELCGELWGGHSAKLADNDPFHRDIMDEAKKLSGHLVPVQIRFTSQEVLDRQIANRAAAEGVSFPEDFHLISYPLANDGGLSLHRLISAEALAVLKNSHWDKTSLYTEWLNYELADFEGRSAEGFPALFMKTYNKRFAGSQRRTWDHPREEAVQEKRPVEKAPLQEKKEPETTADPVSMAIQKLKKALIKAQKNGLPGLSIRHEAYSDGVHADYGNGIITELLENDTKAVAIITNKKGQKETTHWVLRYAVSSIFIDGKRIVEGAREIWQTVISSLHRAISQSMGMPLPLKWIPGKTIEKAKGSNTEKTDEKERQRVLFSSVDAIANAVNASPEEVRGVLQSFDPALMRRVFCRRFNLSSPLYLSSFKNQWSANPRTAMLDLAAGVFGDLAPSGHLLLESLPPSVLPELGTEWTRMRILRLGDPKKKTKMEIAWFPELSRWLPIRITGENRPPKYIRTVLSANGHNILSIGVKNVLRDSLRKLMGQEKALLIYGAAAHAGLILAGTEESSRPERGARQSYDKEIVPSGGRLQGIYRFKNRDDELYCARVGVNGVATAVHFLGDNTQEFLRIAVTIDANGRVQFHESHIQWKPNFLEDLYDRVGPFFLAPLFLISKGPKAAAVEVSSRYVPAAKKRVVHSYFLNPAYLGHRAWILIGPSGVPIHLNVEGAPDRLPNIRQYLKRIELRGKDNALIKIFDSAFLVVSVSDALKEAEKMKALVVATDISLKKSQRGLIGSAGGKDVYIPSRWLPDLKVRGRDREVLAEIVFDPAVSLTGPIEIRIGYYDESDPLKYATRKFHIIRTFPVKPTKIKTYFSVVGNPEDESPEANSLGAQIIVPYAMGLAAAGMLSWSHFGIILLAFVLHEGIHWLIDKVTGGLPEMGLFRVKVSPSHPWWGYLLPPVALITTSAVVFHFAWLPVQPAALILLGSLIDLLPLPKTDLHVTLSHLQLSSA